MGIDAAERGIQCTRRSYEEVRSVPRKAGIRCPLPQPVERSLVALHSLLFSSLRTHL
jgi:hypothetical protein